MTRNAALAKRKLGGGGGEGKELEGRGAEAGLVQIERTRGAGARTVKDMEEIMVV